ncbi:hypothetical protein AWU65_03670 [Paenibacillus glucanolyticus]|jgi:hypothetical protein|uniref:Uncharacterized protein n=1 Tax=Paenibacillus glucanolyticus TaxID=59843 RepID=A0A163GQ84_9BACL|nr:hypothetical protein AWU65_03670 [Paenibacillus glucanolyticus]OMF65489.1 hypothetical protein BK142_30825 [Paenibacillus glucanolyticus]
MNDNFSICKGYFSSFGLMLISIIIVSYFPGKIQDDGFGYLIGFLVAGILFLSSIGFLLTLIMIIFVHKKT